MRRLTCVGQMKIAVAVGGENRELAEEAISKIDVIAPIKILQQILKTPHSKSRLSIQVQRAGHTVVLIPGPDAAESEKLLGKPIYSLGVSFQNYAEASLGLSPVRQQVPTLLWHEAWLDNDMTSVPELAICNHLNGVVQGYELIMPDGNSGDAPSFDPNVVQQNGLAVLRFLQSNCKEDPGVYWLYKSAGEDMLQLFDLSTISKNHSSSSSSSSFPLVVRSCAHEQFARFILNTEEEFVLTVEANNVQRKVKVADLQGESLDHATSLDIGPVCQYRAPLTTISSQRAAVHHVIQSIKYLMRTRQLVASEQEEVQWLPTSRLDRKLWNLVLLLGESYLSLGEAYKEDGQLLRALNIVELACSIYGSIPHKFGDILFASAMYPSFSRLINVANFEQWLNLDLEPSPSTSANFTRFASVRIFWAKAWLMVGDITIKLQEGYEVTEKEEMPFEITEELEKLKKKLAARSTKCDSCLLVNCTCVTQNKNKNKNKKSWVKANPRGSSSRGGIFKYLTRSSEADAESNLLAALDCYQQTQAALSPSDRKELEPLFYRKAWVWTSISQERFDSKKTKAADEAMAEAMVALKESDNREFAVCTIVNYGVFRKNRALQKQSSLHEQHKRLTQLKDSQLRSAERTYKEALKYFLTAEKELRLAIEKGYPVPELMRSTVYSQLGAAYRHLGSHLDRTAVAPHVISPDGSSPAPGQLSAIDAYRRAVDSYEHLGEAANVAVAGTGFELAGCHRTCCKMFLARNLVDKANEHALVADEIYQKSLKVICPENENEPELFLHALLEDSAMSFLFQHQPNFFQMLESDLSGFLEGYHISKEDEEKLDKELLKKFWAQLQMILKNLVAANRSGTGTTVKELYLASLKATSLSDLHNMHALWTTPRS